MKSNIKVFLCLIIITFSLAMLGCGGSSSSDTATISISLSTSPGKTTVSISQLRHVITLSGPTGKQTFTVNGAGSVKAIVAPGLWQIDVQAFYENALYATGSGSAEVIAGQNTDVLIYMTVVWSEPILPGTSTPFAPTPVFSNYNLIAETYSDLYIHITLTSKAKVVIPDGNYDYTAQLLDVTISSGTATFGNNVLTFTASDGDTFSYDVDNDITSGHITLTLDKMDELNTAAGTVLSLPSILDLITMTGVDKGINWDGTWVRERQDGTSMTQKITFSGDNYTHTSQSGATESGTFKYNDSGSPMFIFYRPGNQTAIYRWEGIADDPTRNFIEFYNWTNDPMGIALNYDYVNELFDAWQDVINAGYISGNPEYDAAETAYNAADAANPLRFIKQ